MYDQRPIARAVAAALMGCLAACAPTVNHLDPAGPRFVGSYATYTRRAGGGRDALRVVTFNVKWGRDIDGAVALLARDPALRSADVLALQEVDERGVDRIARALSLNYAYYPAALHPVDHRNFGVAILTPWPIEADWKLVLPHVGALRHQRRAATGALVRVAGRRVRVYAVHLEVPFRISAAQREDQVAAVLADAAGTPEPVVIAGDFNSYAVGEFLEAQGFAWTTKQVGPTVSVLSYDHIFARGLTAPDSVSAGVVRDVNGVSDHRPVWTELR